MDQATAKVPFCSDVQSPAGVAGVAGMADRLAPYALSVMRIMVGKDPMVGLVITAMAGSIRRGS